MVNLVIARKLMSTTHFLRINIKEDFLLNNNISVILNLREESLCLSWFYILTKRKVNGIPHEALGLILKYTGQIVSSPIRS